jgi:hypothetical protein
VGARFDMLGIAVTVTATLPWLVVAGVLLPRLTETLVAGAVMALVILVVFPRRGGPNASSLLVIGMVCFYVPVVLGQQGSGDQLIQAAKYVVFPAMAFAVTQATNNRALVSLRTAALWSSFAAVTINFVLGLAGLEKAGSYNAGENLGFASAHDLALLAGCVTAASLAAAASSRWIPAVLVGAMATVATGVRSTLPGLGLLAIARMFSAGTRIRTILLVVLAVVAIFVSGAAHVVEARFHHGESRGEFKSFSALGSGRGEIYTAAIDSWRASSPIHWLIGTGSRSTLRIEQEKLGTPFVGHSDLVEVLVQFGIVGLIGFLLIWGVLIAHAQSKSPLLVLASFSVFNGMLEYSAPLVIALLLTAGVRNAHDRTLAPKSRMVRPVGGTRSSNVLKAPGRA